MCSGQRDRKPPKKLCASSDICTVMRASFLSRQTDSKLTLRGIAKDIASGAITIEDVEKNYLAPALP
ncbi:hypothetical protein OUZ56_032164 [Daphnia magna]|uniref:Uncharacterized protein n=1 Tax=Daphnia magna TaxID=35525 RepID=A0ABQ9ZX45_9CRUS|nr:hypothetical protein OUZ56_032164 [Daphnia magna]